MLQVRRINNYKSCLEFTRFETTFCTQKCVYNRDIFSLHTQILKKKWPPFFSWKIASFFPNIVTFHNFQVGVLMTYLELCQMFAKD